MKLIEDMKTKARQLKHEITALYYAYQNPKLPLLSKIMIITTIAYALSPIDLIPDFIPVLGYLDDLIILPLLISVSLRLIPKSIMQEARHKAQQTALKLRNNWSFSVLFIMIWLVISYFLIKILLQVF